MKKHNTVKVVLITILVLLLLSWIFPAAYYSNGYVDQGRVQMGLAELFNYFMTSMSYFGHFAIYIVLVGVFYGILYKIPAYRTFLDKIVTKFKGKEKLFVGIVVILFAAGVSVAGIQIPIAFFIPFVVSIILLLGYDKIVAALVVVGSLAAGLIGTTYAASTLSLLNQILGLEISSQIGVRIVILLVSIILVLFNIFMLMGKKSSQVKVAAKKEVVDTKPEKVKEEVVEKKTTKTSAKKTTTKSGKTSSTKKKSTKSHNKAALRDEDIIVVKESVLNSDSENDSYLIPTRVEVTHHTWPFAFTFILMFILIVMAFITWGEGGFGITWFDDVTTKFTEFELFGFPIFTKVYGAVSSFGNWTVIDLFLPMFLVLLILVLMYNVKFDDILDGALTGAKKALAPAFVVLLLYTILVLVTYHPYQMVFYKAILGLTKGFNIATAAFTAILSSFFNVDPAYIFQASLPYYASLVTDVEKYPMIAIVYQGMYGFTSLFAPTSLILMTVLAYLKVNYKDWFKAAWKLLLEMFVLLLIIFIILAVI